MKPASKVTSAGFLFFFLAMLIDKLRMFNVALIPMEYLAYIEILGISLIIIGTIMYFTQ